MAKKRKKKKSFIKSMFKFVLHVLLVKIAMIALDITGTTSLIGMVITDLLESAGEVVEPALESVTVALGDGQTADGLIAHITENMHPGIKIHDIGPVDGGVVFKVAEGKGDWARKYAMGGAGALP